MKFYLILIISVFSVRNIVFSQNDNNSRLDSMIFDSIKNPIQIITMDSIVDNTTVLRLTTSFYCDTNVYLDNKKSVCYKNYPDYDFHVLFLRAVDAIEQKIEFTPNDLYFNDEIREKIGLKKEDEIISIFSNIYLLKGKKENLYYITDFWLFADEINTLYTEQGQLVWWELSAKGRDANSGNIKSILKRYGLNIHATEDNYLKTYIPIHHLLR